MSDFATHYFLLLFGDKDRVMYYKIKAFSKRSILKLSLSDWEKDGLVSWHSFEKAGDRTRMLDYWCLTDTGKALRNLLII